MVEFPMEPGPSWAPRAPQRPAFLSKSNRRRSSRTPTSLAVFLALVIAYSSLGTPIRNRQRFEGPPTRSVSRRQALHTYAAHREVKPTPPRVRKLKNERLLSPSQIESIGKDKRWLSSKIENKAKIKADSLAPRIAPGRRPNSQALEPSALVWNPGLLDNMVQMAQNQKLFNEVLVDTRLRVRQLVQDDVQLLSSIDTLSIDGRLKSPESITRKLLYKSNEQQREKDLHLQFQAHAQQLKTRARGKMNSGGPLNRRGRGRRKEKAEVYQLDNTFSSDTLHEKQGRNENIKNVYDVVGLRVIVDASEIKGESEEDHNRRSEQLCYRIRDLISSTWETIPFREKDYVAKPKRNGYQSLHLTAVVNYHLLKIPVEFQIRTVGMDESASEGAAAHNKYKEHFIEDLVANSFPANSQPEDDEDVHVNNGDNNSVSEPKKCKTKRSISKNKKSASPQPKPQPQPQRHLHRASGFGFGSGYGAFARRRTPRTRKPLPFGSFGSKHLSDEFEDDDEEHFRGNKGYRRSQNKRRVSYSNKQSRIQADQDQAFRELEMEFENMLMLLEERKSREEQQNEESRNMETETETETETESKVAASLEPKQKPKSKLKENEISSAVLRSNPLGLNVNTHVNLLDDHAAADDKEEQPEAGVFGSAAEDEVLDQLTADSNSGTTGNLEKSGGRGRANIRQSGNKQQRPEEREHAYFAKK